MQWTVKAATSALTVGFEKFILQIKIWKLSASAQNTAIVSSEITVTKSITRKYVKLRNVQDTNVTTDIQGNAFSSENMGAASLDPFVLINTLLVNSQPWKKK